MNLADYLDAALQVRTQPQTLAPYVQRVNLVAQPPAPQQIVSTTRTVVAYSPPAPARAMPMAPVAIPTPPTSFSPPPASSVPQEAPPMDQPQATVSPAPVFVQQAQATVPPPPAETTQQPPPDQQQLPDDGSSASGDSGTSSSGFGWLLLVAGAYLLYRGTR